MGKVVPPLLAVLFLLSAFVPGVASGATITQTTTVTSSTDTIIGLNSTILPVSQSFNPAKIKGYFGTDLGPVSWTTSLSGFTWNATKGVSLTLGPPTIGISLQSITQSFYNSSVTAFQFTGLTEYFKPQHYQTNIILKGTGTGVPVCLPLTGTGGQINYNKTANPTQANLGVNILDWSDIPQSMLPVFSLNSLCFTPPIGPYVIDPVAIDGTGSCLVSSGLTCTASLTTSVNGDIIAVVEHDNSPDCTTPTATSYTFHQRAIEQGGDSDCVAFYYDTQTTATTLSIACNWSGPANIAFCLAFGISGAASGCASGGTGCFDSHSGLPCTSNAGGVSSNPSCTISTSNANDIIFGFVSEGNSHTWTAGSGFSFIKQADGNSGVCATSSANRRCDEYQVVSATQTNLAVTITMNVQDSFWDMIADAIKQAASTVTQPIKIATANGASSATITITGCSPSNSTFTANNNVKTYSLTASCTVTLTVPTDGSSTRYRFNISPHPTASTTVSFSTCSSGTCSEYDNTTNYQLKNTYQATPQTPNTWDAAYSWSTTGTFVGVGSTSTACTPTTSGGGAASCSNVWYDYNLAVSLPALIGNTWAGQSPLSFTDTTGGNTHNVNYIQSSGGNGVSSDYGYLVVFAIVPVGVVLIAMAKRSRDR